MGIWLLPILISIDGRGGLEFGGIVKSPPKSLVNPLQYFETVP